MPDETILHITEISLFGGFICPGCNSEILIPPGYVLIAGEVLCQVCSKKLYIDSETAELANSKRDKLNLVNLLLNSKDARVFFRK